MRVAPAMLILALLGYLGLSQRRSANLGFETPFAIDNAGNTSEYYSALTEAWIAQVEKRTAKDKF